VRRRAEAHRKGIRMAMDVRLRFRAVNRVVLIAAAGLGSAIVYMIGENFGPR